MASTPNNAVLSQTPQNPAEVAAARTRLAEAKRNYGRGKEISLNRVRDKKLKANLKSLENKYKDATLKARDAEILHETAPGLLEAEDELEKTYRVRQEDIKDNVDIQTAQKGFELKLEGMGPYVFDYTRNGREILIAGRKGHVATMDWRDGKLGCELQLGETVRDAKWLHNNQLFAVAERSSGIAIYDRAGVEIHKLQKHIDVTHMEFLPYHFLLASIGKAGWLKYTDTSTGQMVTELATKQGAPTAFRQNPWNAIMHVGHQNGSVSLWSPNSSTALVKLLPHRGPVRSLAMDREGRYMVSTGQDLKMAVWDVRMFKEVNAYHLRQPGTSVSISDRGLAAVGWGTQVSIWQGLFDKNKEDQVKMQRPYMAWGGEGQHIERVRWCPFEDVLGVSHDKGFSSILVPGAGEATFDSLEVNPYENTKQRQEAEVRGLLNKLQPEMISLNPDFVGDLDLVSAAQRKKERDLDRPADDPIANLRNRGRGKNSSLRKHLRKKGTKNVIDERRLKIEAMMKEQNNKGKIRIKDKQEELGPALARFARKTG